MRIAYASMLAIIFAGCWDVEKKEDDNFVANNTSGGSTPVVQSKINKDSARLDLVRAVIDGAVPALPNRALRNAVLLCRRNQPRRLLVPCQGALINVPQGLSVGNAQQCKLRLVTAIAFELGKDLEGVRKKLTDAIQVLGAIPGAVKVAAVALRTNIDDADLRDALVDAITDAMADDHPRLVQLRQQLQLAIAEKAARDALRGEFTAQDEIPQAVWEAWQPDMAANADIQPVLNAIVATRPFDGDAAAAGRWARVIGAYDVLVAARRDNAQHLTIEAAQANLVEFIMPADRDLVDPIVAHGQALTAVLEASPFDEAQVGEAQTTLFQTIDAANLGQGNPILLYRNSLQRELSYPAAIDAELASCLGAIGRINTRDPFYDAIDRYTTMITIASTEMELEDIRKTLITAIDALSEDRRRPIAHLYKSYTDARDFKHAKPISSAHAN
jgi:hypothetical protein